MRSLDRIRFWFLALPRRRRAEAEMVKEMRLHLELEIENNLRLGMPPDEARRAALIAFGGVERAKDAVRDERPGHVVDETLADLRYAARTFRRRPGFAAAVIVLIAFGVGANAAIFSVIDHVMLRPLPYRDGNRMVQFVSTTNNGLVLVMPLRRDIDAWRDRAHDMERITYVRESPFELGDPSRDVIENVFGVMISPGTSALVGMHPMLGRDVSPADTLSDAAPVALLSRGLWERRFGGASGVVGRTIWLNGQAHTVIGVMPLGFGVPFEEGAQVFTALRSAGPNMPVQAIGKLRNDVSIESANGELNAILAQERGGPDAPRGALAQGTPKLERAVDMVGSKLERTLLLLFGAVCAVLLIVCANVANLFLAHAWSRQREFGIRSAIGAGRGRLARQVMTESLVLSVAGGVLGFGIAAACIRLMSAAEPMFSEIQTLHLDAAMVGWSLGVSIVTGIAFSIAPVMFVTGQRVGQSLEAGARSAGSSRGARRLRAALVVTEVALSVVLLAGAGLLVRTLSAMQHVDIGMEPNGLIGITMRLTDPQLLDDAARHAAADAVLDRVRRVPGVEDAALAMTLPPRTALGLAGVQIEGGRSAASDTLSAVAANSATPEFFRVSGIRLLEGRLFAPDRSNSALVDGDQAIVNDAFARRFWPDGQAIGHRIKIMRNWATIVGIAADVRVPGKDGPADLVQVYMRMPGAPRFGTIIVRSGVPMAVLVPRIRNAVRVANPFVKVGDAESAEAVLAKSRAMQRMLLGLLGAFAVLALVIATFGVHAVIAYAVNQRTREIGVRVALGAQARDVASLVFRHGFALTGAGLVVGVAAAIAAARSLRGLLYEVGPADPVTLVAVAGLIGTVALIASVAPARRAARVDPIEALKAD